MMRQIIFFGNYFTNFYEKQAERVKTKNDYVLYLIAKEERVPVKFLKHMESHESLYEIRVTVGRNNIRMFCFFDKSKLIVVLNAFQKKSQKTPPKEIALAEKLRREYFEEKSKRR